MSKTIEVDFTTLGIQARAQVQNDIDAHKWTIWDKYGLERSYNDVVAFARFMTKG